MPNNPDVTFFDGEDAATLADIHRAAFGDAAWSQQQIADSLTLDTTRGLTAECGDQIVGFILLQRVGDEGEILTFCVHPDYQRQQIGERLLVKAIDFVREMQGTALFLEVAADNIAAGRLYEKTGFQKIGTRPKYYKRGMQAVDAINYRLQITP